MVACTEEPAVTVAAEVEALTPKAGVPLDVESLETPAKRPWASLVSPAVK
jgi:hypothetical protein